MIDKNRKHMIQNNPYSKSSDRREDQADYFKMSVSKGNHNSYLWCFPLHAVGI